MTELLITNAKEFISNIKQQRDNVLLFSLDPKTSEEAIKKSIACVETMDAFIESLNDLKDGDLLIINGDEVTYLRYYL